ncbi:MAG: glutamate synthase subunit beta [Betaproteobacteria bacterium]|nr:glutamate synthase subunit beta [Betaproteobacteria bacterium]MDE2002991.1 glutamate synthase subunit beta [Betaproteobacteria bacterium]MDE2208737.1 glutamate synthase subunit beta [Betaproteobacteria bacterium]MDE2358018.1 glutamate synthase subunit beta [Betaproteobacteria bacterium]
MGKITGFLEFQRIAEVCDPVTARLRHYREFVHALDDAAASKQGARCMDCGIPFCQSGCPVNNIIPDWNDLVYRQQWKDALDVLHSTNNFPEFTGRVCPAPCEAACTLNINSDPVGIKSIEHFIIDKGWEEGWVVPQPAAHKTGRRVAVIGSGPAGLACAQQLARAGHDVVVFEKADRIGGLLRYGIPDFKMEKHLIDRRMAQMSIEGVEFRPNSRVGGDVDARALLAEYDAIVLAGGAEKPRDLPVPGRELDGVHFAMDFLPQQNRVVAGDAVDGQITATGKHVIVIGGGDTGSDCVGTSNRQGAASVTQFELLQQPPAAENKPLVWPYWPIRLRTSSSHEEGCDRDWSVSTRRFEGSNGRVERLVAVRVDWRRDGSGAMRMVEMPGTEFAMKAELVLLAMGFTGPGDTGLLEQLGVERDARSNVKADTDGYRTSVANVFAAGDTRRGQSLVVWAIHEGRQCARAVDAHLMGASELPR